jgi:hypothetical protein
LHGQQTRFLEFSAQSKLSSDRSQAIRGLASTDVVEIRSDARCGVVVWAGVAIGPVG